MVTILKCVVGLVGLICLAFFFPFIHEFFSAASGNSTNPGILHMMGTDNTGAAIYVTNRNIKLIRFVPYLFPVVIFVVIGIYVVTSRGRKPE